MRVKLLAQTRYFLALQAPGRNRVKWGSSETFLGMLGPALDALPYGDPRNGPLRCLRDWSCGARLVLEIELMRKRKSKGGFVNWGIVAGLATVLTGSGRHPGLL